MPVHLRLVHAEPGSRVVEARAVRQGDVLLMALGEAATAEEAEDRARQRLQQQLAELPAEPVTASFEATPSSPGQTLSPPLTPQMSTAEEPNAKPAAAPEAAAIREVAAAHSSPAAPVGSTGPAVRAAESSGETANAPVEEPPPDPEDWSAELARIDLAMKRIGWQREQEGQFLERAFGHPSRSRLTTYNDLLAYLRLVEELEPGSDPHTAPVPLRRGELLSQSDALLSQLGWNAQQGRQFLERQLGRGSRQQLNDSELLQFNMLLEEALLEVGPADQLARVD
jgi:hypothetical protein